MNKLILCGRVGQDPTVKKFDNGGQVVQFTLATSSRWKDKQGEKQERTEWHNIVIFGKLSEVAEKYVKKGSHLLLEGEVRYRSYDKEGTKVYITEIFANSMEMLGGKKEENINNPSNTEAPITSDNDLPF